MKGVFQMERLILICEGGAHTVEYFHKNGVFPGAVVLVATKFREMVPYLTKDDEVLVVIKGLTDFSMAEIYALLNDIEESRDKLKGITVMSNINLGKISSPYYLYSGDLFYGTVKEVKNGRHSDVSIAVDPTTLTEKKVKPSKKDKVAELKAKTPEIRSINAVISGYKKYDKRDVKFTIYGSNAKEVEPTHEIDGLTQKLIAVDLYK
jgi:hypothetical protein